MANAIRALAMDAVEKAKSGHPGMPMGMADVGNRPCFTRFLKFDASAPDWADRDRFVLFRRPRVDVALRACCI
jgi:transketolase